MRPTIVLASAARFLLVALLALASASFVDAQTSVARLTGFVTDENGRPIPDVTVTARSVGTNAVRGARTSDRGFYALQGLSPELYEVTAQRIGLRAQTRQVRPQIGQTLEINFTMVPAAIQLTGVEVIAEATVSEQRSTEVATNISQEQIENLPLNDRNFLSLAQLAPGVRADGGSITSGAQSANNINVFIDGVSFKSDILVGGVAGQDASRGNPFPQNAIQEFRVITQQYKAEYQRATSAIITAKTKSGTNRWSGDLFGLAQHEGLIQQDYFAILRCREREAMDPPLPCVPQAKVDKYQMGGSVGGPIIRDRLFFFGSYEGNHQTRANTVLLGSGATGTTAPPPELVNELRTYEGTFSSPFRSNLWFGKLTYVPAERHTVELSANIRDEFDIRSFGGTDSYDNAEYFYNTVDTYQLRHQYVRNNWLNEAHVSWQSYRWNPIPLFEEKVGLRYAGVLKIGGRSTRQDFDQQRLAFRNDVSYNVSNWFGDHVFKGGVNVDFLEYKIIRFLNGVPEYRFNNSNSWAFPFEAVAGFGNPDLSTDNQQIGLFLQDDWNVSRRLMLNLGVRWDYETNMLNNDYVTPDSVRQAVNAFRATLPCDGSDPKREQLCDPSPYLTDGTDRPPFLGAIQPRLGFSYDLLGTGNTTLFGGYGLYYDRNRYGNVLGEQANLQWTTYTFRFSEDGLDRGGFETVVWEDRYMTREGLQEVLQTASAPRPELFLTKNETKPPMAHQFTMGLRQQLGAYALSASYTGVRGYNVFTWIRANRRADGTCCNQLPQYSNVFVSSDDARNWYDAIYLKAEKRFTEESRWGAQLAYTLGWTEEEADAGGVFSALNVFTVDDFSRYPTGDDERHRLTANWVVGLPFRVLFSGIINLGTGGAYNPFIGFGTNTGSCDAGNRDCIGGNDHPPGMSRNSWRPPGRSFIIPNFWASRNVDLRLEKNFRTLRGQQVGIIGEVFNVFNYANFTGYDMQWGQFVRPADDTERLTEPTIVRREDTFGQPTGAVNDPRRTGAPRRFQLGMNYRF